MSSNLFARVAGLVTICGIELSLTGNFEPVSLDGFQQFNDSKPRGIVYQDAYHGKASVSFTEESDESNAGLSWKQSLSIRFPVTDERRAYRLATIHKVRFIKIKFSNDKSLIMGRNDFAQNARPKIQSKTTEHLAEVQFQTVSIEPAGYTSFEDPDFFPNVFPIIINNTDPNE